MCSCVSAVSVIGVPLCFLLPQSSPYLPYHSIGDKCVSEEINDYTVSMHIFLFIQNTVAREGARTNLVFL